MFQRFFQKITLSQLKNFDAIVGMPPYNGLSIIYYLASPITRPYCGLFLVWPYNKKNIGRGVERLNQYLFGLGSERPCGLMDKASVSDTGDCKFQSCQGRYTFAAKEYLLGFGTAV